MQSNRPCVLWFIGSQEPIWPFTGRNRNAELHTSVFMCSVNLCVLYYFTESVVQETENWHEHVPWLWRQIQALVEFLQFLNLFPQAWAATEKKPSKTQENTQKHLKMLLRFFFKI